MNSIDLYDGITLHQGDCRDIPLIKARFAQGIEAPLDLFGLDGDAA